MAWNLVRTVRAGRAVDGEAEVVIEDKQPLPRARLLLGQPVLVSSAVIGLIVAAGFVNPLAALGLLFLALFLALGGLAAGLVLRDRARPGWHRLIEGRGLVFSVLVVAAVLVGGIAEIVPAVVAGPRALRAEHEPYTPLELEGRDVYLAEGCYTCHSQMIRPFLWEVARYGEVSAATESGYDHPFQWGSRRIGPDLARLGGKYPHLWHYEHLMDPRAVTWGSNMPPYPHLAEDPVDLDGTAGKMRAMRAVGVPYRTEEIHGAREAARAQGQAIAGDLARTGKVRVASDSKMVALIAYLQRLGLEPAPAEPAAAASSAPEEK
jgi:cytochrome c oxidase cbb3-type subunit I/II